MQAAVFLNMRALIFLLLPLLAFCDEPQSPQPTPAANAAPPSSLKLGSVNVSGSFRTRLESWDWFQGEASNDYSYLGSILRVSLSQTRKSFDWQLELAAPFLLGLPDDAVAPGNQGQLGLGASYFVANSRNTNAGMVFAKQGFLRWKTANGQSFKLGRMELIDGTEVTPKNATLAALKRDRIAHRLLGNFGFSHTGRSFDGAQYAFNRGSVNLTLFGGRPTRGVFQVDGWGELNINVFYGALTRQLAAPKGAGEWRLFGIGYNDARDNVLKVDNRPAAARRADLEHINIATYGAHYLHTVATRPGAFDVLFWGALQNGNWGVQKQKAAAAALEAGFQPNWPRLQPWIRAGYNYGSGDGNPNDATHRTFFQILPTPRIYARMPFFNMMNNRDAFGELILRPTKALTIRGDVHSLRLANANDLWYSGGGAFQPWTFGYTGRTTNNQHGLATLADVSVDYNVNTHLTVTAYYGHAAGKTVLEAIYPKDPNGNFGYLEMLWKF